MECENNTLIGLPGVFDNLVVKTPDGNFPLIQLGQVIQKSAQLLTINMTPSPQVRIFTYCDNINCAMYIFLEIIVFITGNFYFGEFLCNLVSSVFTYFYLVSMPIIILI